MLLLRFATVQALSSYADLATCALFLLEVGLTYQRTRALSFFVFLAHLQPSVRLLWQLLYRVASALPNLMHSDLLALSNEEHPFEGAHRKC